MGILTANMQKQISQIVASPFIITYVTRLVRATRPKDAAAPDFIKRLVDWGAGPRAGQNLVNGAKAFAAMEGRPNVSIADVRKVAIPVLRHRIATNFQAQAEGLDIDEIITKLIATVPEPNIPKYER